MRGFLKDAKGAVTVFVTLLLIPAMLVSGSAVDLARIHTARSIVQDANQLAANSLLTQYDALLFDLYGLFGVMADDPELAEMLNNYIELTIFGDGGRRGLGTFQLFYGSNLQPAELLPALDKNLRNEEILRRQIEDYMKFRGPVVIVKEFLDALDGNTLREDSGVINDKLEIDAAIVDMYELYKRLFDAITAADRCNQAIGGVAGGYFGSVSTSLVAIRRQFVDLKAAYDSWARQTDPSRKASSAQWYQAILVNIRSLTTGGPRGSSWGPDGWQLIGNVAGLNSNILNAKQQAENFKPRFDLVVSIGREVDAARNELERKVNALETRLRSGAVGEDLSRAMTEPGPDGKSQMDRYRELLRWENVEAMATAFKNGGYDYLDNKVKPLLDSVVYRNVNNESAGSLTRVQLAGLPTTASFALSGTTAGSMSALFAGFPEDNVTYKIPPGFLKFAEYPGDNRAFFEALSLMMSSPGVSPVKLYEGQADAGGSNPEGMQRGLINSLLNFAQTAYKGLTNNPLGARYINNPGSPPSDNLNILNILAMIPEAVSAPIVNIISDPLGSAAAASDHLLLLTYSTSMFSNYTTTKPDSIGATRNNLSAVNFTKSISGVPISPEVNYFFQSEWEYLYNGSENAGQNLSAVTRLLFLIRLISNYIAVFNVAEVNSIVMSIKTAFSWNPPLAIILGELARAAFAAAETVVDVAALRSGYKVPLFKNITAGEWVCTPSGLMRALSDIALNESVDGGRFNNEKGLSYSNYMLFFFITKAIFYIGSEGDAATELAKRTGNLIEWNVVNYRSGANANESQMAAALGGADRFYLRDMITDFSIGHSVDLRMLFLSMPLAQRGVGGVVPPRTMPIEALDYRGY